ncbi:anti-sigma factor domain-containing protein [Pseudonocardia sp. WMMC193]|uniref:anti-sigma factor n=1 Tax=Pseudonocardia sp. WMMC193 TaxID=2911965 RepID=UPI001EFFB7FE|nr:anti-sigma factor [Pseudonocardia sp. WMMC193]MCF7553034.1 anti-sigma factor [Pseudonocardia sp. WMMC193]
MRTTTPCPMSRELVGFALHALEPADELAVQRHVAGCAECTAALPDYQSLLAALGRAIPEARPPADLRARILDRAAPPTTAGPRPHPPVRPLRPTTLPRHAVARRRPRRLVGTVLAVACAIAVGGLAGAAVDRTGSTLDRAVAAVATPGDARSTLHDEAGTAVAAVVAGDGTTRLVVAALPANDATNSVYVLWGIGSGQPRPLGTFDARSAGTEVVTLAADPGAVGYAVSLEPGRTAPTTPSRVVASGQV